MRMLNYVFVAAAFVQVLTKAIETKQVRRLDSSPVVRSISKLGHNFLCFGQSIIFFPSAPHA